MSEKVVFEAWAVKLDGGGLMMTDNFGGTRVWLGSDADADLIADERNYVGLVANRVRVRVTVEPIEEGEET